MQLTEFSTRLWVTFVVLALASPLVCSGCGRRHVTARIRLVAQLRVVDAETSEGIEGAEVLVGSAHVKDAEWCAAQIESHRVDPGVRVLGLSGFGLTDRNGRVTILYMPRRSWMEEGLARGGPKDCPLNSVWIHCRGYKGRVVEVSVHSRPTRGDGEWAWDVTLPDVPLHQKR